MLDSTTRIAALGLAALLALSAAFPVVAADTVMFSGSYDWKQGGTDELTALFEPDGERRWTVKFRFRWNGDRKSWSGTAEGTLEDGSELTGTATSGSRSWVFDAEIDNGVMRGRHTELQSGGKEYPTGTFILKR